MRKIIFLLLVTMASFGQTKTGKETPFLNGINIKNVQVVPVSVLKAMGTVGDDGTVGKIDPVNLPLTVASINAINTAVSIKEDKANKATSFATVNNDLFPTVQATKAQLDTKINLAEKGVANGVASLGTDGKVPNSQIPALAISETFPVASQAAMLALTQAEQGDVSVRTDISKSFILRQSPSSVLANWQELLTPTDAVQSVNGEVGNVSVTKASLGLGSVDNTSDLNKPISTAVQTALNAKQPLLTNPITGSGTTNFIPKFTAAGVVGNSSIYDNSGNVGINTTSDFSKFSIKSALPYGVAGTSHDFQIGDASQNFIVGAKQGFWIDQTFDATVIGKFIIGVGDTGNHLYSLGFNVNGKNVLDFERSGNAIFSGGLTAPTFTGNLTGSATKLETSRLINNVAFDGTSNISINSLRGNTYFGGLEKPTYFGAWARLSPLMLSGPNNLGLPDSWYDTIWMNTYGSTDVKGSNLLIMSKYNDYIGFSRQNYDAETYGTIREILHSGNVSKYALPITGGTVTGTITASGGFFNSDKRLKNILYRDGEIAVFKWKDKRDDKKHFGYIAQEVKKQFPDQVKKGDDGMLSVNYVEILVKKVNDLEKQIKKLEKLCRK